MASSREQESCMDILNWQRARIDKWLHAFMNLLRLFVVPVSDVRVNCFRQALFIERHYAAEVVQWPSMLSRLPAFETKPPCFVFFSASDASCQHGRSEPQSWSVALENKSHVLQAAFRYYGSDQKLPPLSSEPATSKVLVLPVIDAM